MRHGEIYFVNSNKSRIFASDFRSEITRRYARSCNRKCEKLPDYSARRCNGSRV